jgi:hypothetical protein
MWNGNQQQSQQYATQIPSRLDFSNQMQAQRLPPRQTSPSPVPHYPQPSSHTKPNFPSAGLMMNQNRKFPSLIDLNVSSSLIFSENDHWSNPLCLDPAIISFGNKLENPSSQWSSTTQSHVSSTTPSGTNLISTARWSQMPSNNQTIPFPTHMMTNGIYAPYSTTSSADDGNRS